MKNRLTDLRNHLFETIEVLKDKEDPMPVERARAISEVAGKLIESGKVELQLLEIVAEHETTPFFDTPLLALPPARPHA